MGNITRLFQTVILFDGFNSDKRRPLFMEKTIDRAPPPGCKEYAFTIFGKFSRDGDPKILRAEVVFKCVALNDKNALRKFNNWLVGRVTETRQIIDR